MEPNHHTASTTSRCSTVPHEADDASNHSIWLHFLGATSFHLHQSWNTEALPELEYRGVTRVGISSRYRMSSRYQSWNLEALQVLEFRGVTRVGIPSRYVS